MITRLAFLAFLSFSALAFDKSDLEFLRKNNMLERQVRLHSDEWGVESFAEKDSVVYRGQGKSMVDWENLDANSWLDFNQWKKQREILDNTPNWRILLRDLSHSEQVAKVVQCLNICRGLDSTGSAKVQFGSVIREGEEFKTLKDSYAWLYLMDGTLVRVSPESSLSFIEINLAKNKVWLAIRLNYGHVYFQHRKAGEFEAKDLAETDLAMYPLLLEEANREHFARMEYQNMRERLKTLYYLERNPGHISQYEELNRLTRENKDLYSQTDSEIFLYTPNTSLTMENASFHVFYEINGESWFKIAPVSKFKPLDGRKASGFAGYRGYTNDKKEKLSSGSWYRADPEGENISTAKPPKTFDLLEHFVKRVPAVQLAREHYLRKLSGFLIQNWDPKVLAEKYGYRLWDRESELAKRKEFVEEYARRVETTNLKSLKKVFAEKTLEGFGPRYYSEALDRSLAALKSSRDLDQAKVRETSDVEYYIWILKNGKEFLPTYFR